jgi:hypothetical protein
MPTIFSTGLSYTLTNKPEKIAPDIEKLLRKEVGAPTPLTWQIQDAGTGGVTVGSLLKDWTYKQEHLRHNAVPLYYIRFALSQPRPFELQVTIDREGLGAIGGILAYAAPLRKPVRGPIRLAPAKLLGYSNFVGDPETVARLNSTNDLRKLANHLAMTQAMAGKVELNIARYLEILPAPTGSVLLVHSLARTGLLGISLGAKDLIALANALEAAL